MKKSPIAAAILFLVPALMYQPAIAQEDQELVATPSKPSFGISAGHYRHDPGFAIEYTTRGVFQNHLSLRLKAGKQWLERYQAIHREWVSYHTCSAALVYNGNISDRARFYAEFGLTGVIPNSKFSDVEFVDGLYEMNGLEINLLEKENYTVCLFLGLGPSFIKAYAEKMEGRPRYGHGLHYINGLRIYMGK